MSHSSTPPSMRQIIEELKQYFSLQYEWIKLDGIEKLTRIISALIILTLSIILISIVLLYLSLLKYDFPFRKDAEHSPYQLLISAV